MQLDLKATLKTVCVLSVEPKTKGITPNKKEGQGKIKESERILEHIVKPYEARRNKCLKLLLKVLKMMRLSKK